jgi:Pectate lyase superfamily protein
MRIINYDLIIIFGYKFYIMKNILTLLIFLNFTFSILQAQQTVYPTGLAWNNAVVNFGCVANGITDNTTNLRLAAQTYASPYFTNIVVYLPKGTYLISDSIQLLSTYYDANVTFLGEDSANTIIKLIDNAPNFQDSTNPRPMIRTRGGNQAFSMYFQNLTINTGKGNKGAIALDYCTSNYGAVEHVLIKSEDSNANVGIAMTQTWPGPGIIKNVTVKGFKTGIQVTQCEYSMTLENIAISNCKVGVDNNCNTLAIRKLNTTNTTQPVINTGRITILESNFSVPTASTHFGIVNNGVLFARQCTSNGLMGVINTNGSMATPTIINEYHSGPDYSVFANDGKSLNLPIEETPNYYNNDTTQWAKANSFNCLPTNPIYGTFDAGPGLQAAFNSGAKVIYFDRMGDNGSAYCIYNDIIIPSSVEMIIGFNMARFSFYNNSKLIIDTTTTNPIIFDGMAGVILLNNSQRTTVFKHASLGVYNNTIANTNAKVFLEDIGVAFKPQFPVMMWARQYNPEIQPEADTAIVNNNGSYWILGLKTEGRACIASTYNGGKTEILGALVYPSSSFTGNANTAFKVTDACMSISTLTRTSYVGNGWFGTSINETQNGVTINYSTPNTFPAFWDLPFYATSKNACNQLSSLIQLKPKVILGGYYDNTTNLMRDSLRHKSLIPITNPYGTGVYNLFANANNSKQDSIGTNVLNITGPNAIVDWVQIQLRSKQDSSVVLYTKSALLQRDGDVVSAHDGNSAVTFIGALPDQYFVSIKHRNHIGIMLAQKMYVGTNASTIDFTNTSTMLYTKPNNAGNPAPLTGASMVKFGKRLLYPGNASIASIFELSNISYNNLSNSDRTILFNATGGTNTIIGYTQYDLDGNGTARFNGLQPDRNVILNACAGSNILYVKEQLP